MKDIGLAFDIRDKNYGPPTAYLGANAETFHMSDGKYAWSINLDSYVAAFVQTIKYLLSEDNRYLKSGKSSHKVPLTHGYRPDLYVTD